jgi:hypothetical protein
VGLARSAWDGLGRIWPAFSTRPFNVLANLASVLGLFVALLGAFKWDAEVVPLVYLCLLSLFLVIRYVRHERWARYAEAGQVMKLAHQRLKIAGEGLIYRDSSRSDFLEKLQPAVGAFAEAFTLVTGTNCRASIQEVFLHHAPPLPHGARVQTPTEALYAGTLVRSERTAKHGPEAPQPVDGNTDFSEVLQTGLPWIGNDLPAAYRAGTYRNTKWTPDIVAKKNWPYRSAIVWPIKSDALAAPRGEDAGDAQPPALAFLCVDSKKRNAFYKRPDVDLGEPFAQALYSAMYAYVADAKGAATP